MGGEEQACEQELTRVEGAASEGGAGGAAAGVVGSGRPIAPPQASLDTVLFIPVSATAAPRSHGTPPLHPLCALAALPVELNTIDEACWSRQLVRQPPSAPHAWPHDVSPAPAERRTSHCRWCPWLCQKCSTARLAVICVALAPPGGHANSFCLCAVAVLADQVTASSSGGQVVAVLQSGWPVLSTALTFSI